MQDVVVDIISRRRDRVLAVLLGLKEREVDQYLPPDVRSRLRKAILDQLNDYTVLVLDILRSSSADDKIILNEIWLEKLEEIHQAVVLTNGHK